MIFSNLVYRNNWILLIISKFADKRLLPEVMYGYITNFFGCLECRENFKKEVLDLPYKYTEKKEDAILWLWKMHNKVNKRYIVTTVITSYYMLMLAVLGELLIHLQGYMSWKEFFRQLNETSL